MFKIRTRFAPSPTGSLHIGGLRTALFNYLYAKGRGGDFILRIEDTDQKRYDETALKTLLDSLAWAGIQHDEFYVQSERLTLYQYYAHTMVTDGTAYYCTCSSERLEAINAKKIAEGRNPGYDRHCRERGLNYEDVNGGNYVIRLKMPMHGYTEYTDAIRGKVSFKNNLLNDIVLLKEDGYPTYHLAHVVDDHDMEISHVIRAQEWLPSTPLHLQLWSAFGWKPPVYAHLPVMLNPGDMKGKISKRNPPRDAQGNVVPVLVHDYINGGYLPEAVLNFLCNTGWNYGRDDAGEEVEIYDMAAAMRRFDLKDVIAANSKFPVEKLKWINGVYMVAMPQSDFESMLHTQLCIEGIIPEEICSDDEYLYESAEEEITDLIKSIAPLIQPRIKTMLEGVELARPFFERPDVDKIVMTDNVQFAVFDLIKRLRSEYQNWNVASLEGNFRDYAKSYGLKLRDVCAPIRHALTGKDVSVPLFEMMEILGRDEVLERIEAVLQ